MKKILTALIATMTFGFAGGDIAPVAEVKAVEVTPTYWTGAHIGAGLTANQAYLRGESDWFNDTDYAETGYGFNLIAGYKFYNDGTFGVAGEVRYGQGFWSNNELDSETSFVALKPSYNVNENIDVYMLLGYGHSKVDDGYISVSDNGFVYGGGAEYAVTKNVGVFMDYVVNAPIDFDDDKIENDVITLGVNYKF
jgi:opacity protein-like surface antigen